MKEDNPVPSLDNDFLWEMIEYIQSLETKVGGRNPKFCNYIEDLSNGVETDNEQPNNNNTVKLGNIPENTQLEGYNCWNDKVKFFIANNCIYKYEGWEMALSDATKLLG